MAIKLTEAILCLNCDAIYGGAENGAAGSGQAGACPACGSLCGWPLSQWIRPIYTERRAVARSEASRRKERRAS